VFRRVPTEAAHRSTARSAVRLGGDPVATPWDPEWGEAMRVTGYAVYDETVSDHLLADLGGYGLGAARGSTSVTSKGSSAESVHRARA
jgi:hypothetical protein